MTRTHWLLLGALTLAGCGDDELVLPEPEAPPTPTVQLTVEQPTPVAANLGIAQGSAGSASITRSTGFTGPVTLSTTGLPPGWSVNFIPSILTGEVTTAQVLITVPADVVAGSFSFTVRASATGVSTAAATMTVVANVEQNN